MEFDEYINQFPEEVREKATEVFTSLGGVIEPLEKYKGFVDDKLDPDFLKEAANLAQAIQNNPRAVYDNMARAYGWEATTTLPVEDPKTSTEEGEDDDDPRIKSLQENYDTLNQRMLEQQQAELERQANLEIEAEVARIKKDNELDDQAMRYVMSEVRTQVQSGVELSKAFDAGVESYGKLTEHLGVPAKAPRVLGGSGRIPTGRKDITSMTDAERRRYAVERAQQLVGGN